MEPAEPGTMVFHPGEFLADELEARDLTPTVLLCGEYWTEEHINLLLQGKRRFNVALANHIRDIWGWDTEFWLRLQVQWDAFPALREQPPWPRKFTKED